MPRHYKHRKRWEKTKEVEPNPTQAELPLPRHITSLYDMRNTVMSSDVRLTLKSLATGKSMTYRIERSPYNEFMYFVTHLDLSSGFSTYVGMIKDNEFQTSKRSKVLPSDQRYAVFDFFWKKLMVENKVHPKLEVWQVPIA